MMSGKTSIRVTGKFLGLQALLLVLVPALLLGSDNSLAETKNSKKPTAEWKEIERRLKKEKFSKPFISLLRKKFRRKDHETVLKLNTLGFLKSVDHHELVTDQAVQASRKFLERNTEPLDKAETLFGVDREIIAALLWVETRHGTVTGRFHVPSVYASLLVANTSRSRRYLEREAKKTRLPASTTMKEVKEKIVTRTDRKGVWALTELRALEALFLKNAKTVRNLKGSFAGAFGISQFIPTSYQRHAFTDRSDETPDLADTNDAVLSVANYLKQNGWAANSDSRYKALFHYNNSKDYVEAILALSERLKPAGQDPA